MNFVFKIRALMFALVLLCLASAQARAQAVYFSTRELLADFFRASQNVTYRKYDLAPADVARLKARLGYEPHKTSYTFFVAQTAGKVDGYALLDEENGEHLPISFAVKLSPSGVVERQEVVAYREARGDEVRDASFRKQFVGKTVADPLTCDRDIAIVSGATISSRAMAVGVKRALVLFDQLVRPQLVTAQAGGGGASTRAPAKP